jgi:predicted AlkP superfamily phosphohydrolase/phosphomutase
MGISGTEKKQGCMTSLALVFNPTGDSSHNTRINSSLKELCSYWILLTSDDSESTLNEVRHAMEGINGEVINIAATPADKQTNRLNELLQSKATHLMLLQPGVTVECELEFQLDSDNRSEQVLHLSPSRDIGCWQTSIVPNSVDFWELDNSCNVVARQQREVGRNSNIRVLDHNRFPRRRSPDQDAIKTLLEKHRVSAGPDSAMHIASAFYKRQDFRQAADWFHEALECRANTAVHWLAHFRSAQCLMQLEADWEDVEAHLVAAFNLDPDRMEPLYHLVKHYRETGGYARACDLADIAEQIGEPEEPVEFEPDIYRYRLASEYAECCLQLEHNSKCIEIVNKTLRKASIPEHARRELASLRARAYERVCPVYPVSIHRKNRLLIVIAFRNAGEFLSKCISSIQQQDFHEYRVILVDDASTDGALVDCGKLDKRFTTIVNDHRMGALHNQLQAIREHASEDDIVVHLDGDDWLAHDSALARINEFFNRTGCWLMYGQFESSLGTYGTCEPLAPGGEPLLDQLTKMHFPMHIRAYRAGILFDLLRQDPDLDVLKDLQGNFLNAISDLVLMRALIQVAGAENTRYNEEILYIYNRSNPESHYQTRESMALQRSQSAIVAEKPMLEQANNYHTVEAAAYPETKATTLFLALDGSTPGLIEKWSAEGKLPNLASLLKKCQETQIRCPDGFGNDAFWNSLFTGCLPDETGYFFRMKWNPESYKIEYRGPDQQVNQDSFWTGFANTDAELAIIDMPEVKHGGQINGLEISEWLPHARYTKFISCPTDLRQDLLERFGDDPLKGSTERSTPRSEQETERDMDLLLQSIGQKTRAAIHYLERGGWDFFAVGYQQAHDAGHQFWHLHDPEHSRYSKHWNENHGDPLLKIYQRIDAGIGELVNKAGDNANLIIVSGLSMQSKASCNSILDRILWEIDIYDRRQAGEKYPEQDQFDKRRFFSAPHNNLSGAIRINLIGRESRGVVAEGREYEKTIDMLKQRLSQIIHSDTGEPVIAKFIPIREAYSGVNIDELADLFVLWNREKPIREVSSPYFAPIKVRVSDVLDRRSGDHTGHATLYSNVESMNDESGEINVEDISARLVSLIENSN